MSLFKSFLTATVPGASFVFNKTFIRIALLVIITVLLGGFGYLKYKDNKQEKQTAAQNAVKVEIQEKVIDDLKNVSNNNAVDTQTAVKSGDLTMTVLLDTNKIKQEDTKKTDDIIKKKQERKKQVDQEFTDSKKSPVDEQVVETKTAQININAMWEAYCLHSGDKTVQCTTNT